MLMRAAHLLGHNNAAKCMLACSLGRFYRHLLCYTNSRTSAYPDNMTPPDIALHNSALLIQLVQEDKGRPASSTCNMMALSLEIQTTQR